MAAILEDGEVIEDRPTTLMQLNASEIEQQLQAAHRFPRSIKSFVDEATEMATLTEDIAAECIYALPRGGKTIEGPSARFAEIVASAWGNCRAGARVVDEDEHFVTSQGVFHDLQRNVCVTYEVRRRITDRSGRKFADDMVGVTSNAASSIAIRNAVLKGVPKAFWSPIYDAARAAAIGTQQTLASRRSQMLAHFLKLGATNEQVFAKLEISGEADITLDHLAVLRGVATAIKDGDTTVELAFADEAVPGGRATRSDATEALRGSEKPSRKKAAKKSSRKKSAKQEARPQVDDGAPSETDMEKAGLAEPKKDDMFGDDDF